VTSPPSEASPTSEASPLRVAIDVTTAVTQRAGVGRYTRELVGALAALPNGPDLRPFYAAPQAAYPLGAGTNPASIPRTVRAWRLETLARHLLRRPADGPWDGADVYHAPDVVYPPVGAIPVVATVHDLSYIVYPEYHTRLNGGYLRLLTPTLLRRARLIIAVSDATKRDLVERAGVSEGKVRVVYSGLAAPFMRRPPLERLDEARRRYNLPEAFILSVGTLEPRKNLAGTLRAYGLLRARLAGAPPLALVGGSGWRLDEEGLSGVDVRRLGYVPDEDLVALYAACDLFVYPSLYEGWGFPVAEALALGAPTITSTTSSLPEVAGDAALLVDPRDPAAIAAAMEEALADTATGARLRAAGPARARRFSSERWAADTLQVYREAIEG